MGHGAPPPSHILQGYCTLPASGAAGPCLVPSMLAAWAVSCTGLLVGAFREPSRGTQRIGTITAQAASGIVRDRQSILPAELQRSSVPAEVSRGQSKLEQLWLDSNGGVWGWCPDSFRNLKAERTMKPLRTLLIGLLGLGVALVSFAMRGSPLYQATTLWQAYNSLFGPPCALWLWDRWGAERRPSRSSVLLDAAVVVMDRPH